LAIETLNQTGNKMALVETRHQGLLSRIVEGTVSLIGLIGAAVRASAAVENHRTPAKVDLRQLGIDPKSLPRFI
jgi:hypothetical protein